MHLILVLLFAVPLAAHAACSNLNGTLPSIGTSCNCGTATCTNSRKGLTDNINNHIIIGMYCTVASNRCDAAPPPPSTGFADSEGNFTLAYPGYAVHSKITIPNYGAGSSGVVIVGASSSGVIIDSSNSKNQPLPVLSGGDQNQVLKVEGKLTISYVRIARGQKTNGAGMYVRTRRTVLIHRCQFESNHVSM